MHSYAEFIERKRMSVNEIFVCRELRLYSNANVKLRIRLVVLLSLVREEIKAV